MKKRKLRKWVKIVIFIVGFIVGLQLSKGISNQLKKQQEFEIQAIKYCISQGKNEKKCIEGFYGN